MANSEIISNLIKRIDIETKIGIEGLTAAVIIVFSLLFCYVFLMPIIAFSGIPALLLWPIIVVFFSLIKLLLFSSDRLFHADPEANQYARAFQAYWPSRHLMTKFKLNKEKAEYYWFEKLFNVWKNKDHPRHDQQIRTIRHGYRCRLVYYLIKFLEVLLFLSLIALLLEEVIARLFNWDFLLETGMVVWRIVFVVFIASFYVIFRLTNKTSPDNLTGVWRKYADINQLHIQWIDENVPSLNDLVSDTGNNKEANKTNGS